MFHLHRILGLIALLLLLVSPTYAQDNDADPQVISINGKIFTESQILSEIDKAVDKLRTQVPPQMMGQFLKNKEVTLFPQVISQLTIITQLLKVAEEKKLSVEKSEVDEQIDRIKKMIPDPAQFETLLKQRGTTEAKLREEMTEQALIRKVLASEIPQPATPTDDELKAYYTENSTEFVQPESIAASHILISVTKDAPEAQKESAKAKLLSLKKEIENNKIAFADAAMKNSDCPSSAKGGALGTFAKGQMVKEFEDVAFAAKVGDISDIVETQFGYHLIHVTKHDIARTVPFEEAKADIVTFLQRQADQESMQTYLEALQAKADVKNIMSTEEWNARHAEKPTAPQGAASSGGQKIQIDPSQIQQ
jgi:peptidyl-prolyl cis-trans isomerase C